MKYLLEIESRLVGLTVTSLYLCTTTVLNLYYYLLFNCYSWKRDDDATRCGFDWDSDYMKLFSNEMYFEYVNKKMRKLIPVSKIYYFESYGRKIIIHFSSGQKSEKYEYYGKIQELIDDKCLTNFILIHKFLFFGFFLLLLFVLISYQNFIIT